MEGEEEEIEEYEEEEEEAEEQRKTSKNAPPTRDGSSLIDFFEKSLSASAARLNIPSAAKHSSPSTFKGSFTPKSKVSLPSERIKSKSSVTPTHRESRHPKVTKNVSESEGEELMEDIWQSEENESHQRPKKKRALQPEYGTSQPYWAPQMPSYDAQYYNGWCSGPSAPSSYWNPPQPQGPFPPHPYPFYQQPFPYTATNESKAYYYGLAMGLYQAANLIYQQRVTGSSDNYQTQQGYSTFRQEYENEEELQENTTVSRKRSRSKNGKASTFSPSNNKNGRFKANRGYEEEEE